LLYPPDTTVAGREPVNMKMSSQENNKLHHKEHKEMPMKNPLGVLCGLCGKFNRNLRMLCICVMAMASLLACGCDGPVFLPPTGPDYVRPTIAVMKFENRAGGGVGGWNLGDGFRDVLVDRLMATERFQVIERPEIDEVMKEQKFQQSGATRRQNRVQSGRIKNVEYLIKGTITDFGHVSSKSGSFSWTDRLDIFGRSNKAVVSMILYIVDVESGEIVSSQNITESVSAGDTDVMLAYRNVSFGGKVFYKTPLGKVTEKVIDKAVRRIASEVAARPWQPMIAQVNEGSVILNGGQNRKVKVGAEYEVFELGTPITDPATGDVIGHSTGKTIGRIRVLDVQPQFSVASVASGKIADVNVGQRCKPVETP